MRCHLIGQGPKAKVVFRTLLLYTLLQLSSWLRATPLETFLRPVVHLPSDLDALVLSPKGDLRLDTLSVLALTTATSLLAHQTFDDPLGPTPK